MLQEIARAAPALLAWIAVAAACAPSPEPASPEPRGLFGRAVEAIEASPTFRYTFDFRPTGSFAGSMRAMTGKATIERLDDSGSRYRARIEGWELDPLTGERGRRIVYARQSEEVSLLAEKDEVVWFSSLYAWGPSLGAGVAEVLMYPFFDPRSLAGEAEAELVSWEGREEVHGMPCHVVRVAYRDDPEDSRWCLGVDGGLPRRMEWLTEDGLRDLVITSLEVGVPVSDADFTVEPPPGFSRMEFSAGPATGSQAEPWVLAAAGGETVALEALRGRVVVLDFWATWCAPCLGTMRALGELREALDGEPVVFFAVNVKESSDPIRFAAEQGLELPILLDGDEVHDGYTRGNLPATVVIDAEGRHAGISLGYFGEGSERYLRTLILKALGRAG
jgi:thiol-disulfide isomerase/thioredoxin